ncbi:MAG: polyprenyl synthetase family protein [Arenimonas sp.]|nr:polyprenyl synthetase family protein [Arenimonas sp.]MBP6309941.1 polyprenyl synthetase family protein [Arenimonas sp.]
MSIESIQTLARHEMQQVDTLIRARLSSEVLLINQISEHIIAAGGKRLRPLLTVLAAKAMGYEGAQHTALAAIIEFIHTATLLHDDVVDESDLRRGRKTANALWGNAPSVLVGDFLYSRAFQLMIELDSMSIQKRLADTTNQIAEGEVLQLLHVHNPNIDEATYRHVIERKTAVLFSAATGLAAHIAKASETMQAQMNAFGMHLGLAFQIADDVLDYSGDSDALGKNLGDDLQEGKATLPLIHALSLANEPVQIRLREIIEQGDASAMPEVLNAIKHAGSLQYSLEQAQQHAQLAKQALNDVPDSEWKQALLDLADYSVARTY